MTTIPGKPERPPLAGPLKLALDLGPLAIFFGINAKFGIFSATAAFMAATFIALGISYYLVRRLSVMLMVTGVVVLVFGSLTLYLHDELFIKLKPTIIYALFAAALLGGLALGKPLLGHVFDWAFHLDDAGWRKLTLRWGLFFLAMAVLNEIVHRNFDTNTWVSFKAFGFLPLTFLFAIAQVPLIQRHTIEDEPTGG